MGVGVKIISRHAACRMDSELGAPLRCDPWWASRIFSIFVSARGRERSLRRRERGGRLFIEVPGGVFSGGGGGSPRRWVGGGAGGCLRGGGGGKLFFIGAEIPSKGRATAYSKSLRRVLGRRSSERLCTRFF